MWRFDLEEETEKEISKRVVLNLSKGISLDAVKFITTAEVKSAQTIGKTSNILEKYDVAFLYRNDPQNDSFNFDIRKSEDLT